MAKVLYGGILQIVWLAVLLALTGCGPDRSLSSSVYSSRQIAYQRWKEQKDPNLPVISGSLSMKDAIKLALTYSKPLLAAIQEKEVAKGQVQEAYGQALPKVSGVASYTRMDELRGFEPKGFPIPGGKITFGELDNYSAGLQVRQPIYRGGAIAAAIRAAQLYAYLTDHTVRQVVQMTIFEVASNYNEALLAQHLYDVSRDAVRSAEAHLEDVKAKASQGLASRFDVLRAEVDVSNFRAEMIQQQNRLHLAKARLLKAMGVSQQADIALTDQLTYEPIRPVLEEAVRIAHMNRPDLYAAELGLRLQEEALRVAKSRYWPTIDAVFNYSWARPDPHYSTDTWGDQWTAGLQLEVPIFDGFAREGKIRQEKAALQKRRLELLNAEETTLLEIQQALLSLRDAEQLVESQQLNLQRAEEGLRLAEVGYREGVNTEVEVVDARAALTRARGLYYQATYAHTMARLMLQRAMGILGPGAQETDLTSQPAVEPGRIPEFTPAGQATQGHQTDRINMQGADSK
ncbi:MAG: TolC family protein [Sedimentisphaerales bacterium]|jgi:outer membrane protein|nr:TolC family protein [Sedimentisphaerales bacterium]